MRKNIRCRFYYSEGGCNRGRNCAFSHGDPGENPGLILRQQQQPFNPNNDYEGMGYDQPSVRRYDSISKGVAQSFPSHETPDINSHRLTYDIPRSSELPTVLSRQQGPVVRSQQEFSQKVVNMGQSGFPFVVKRCSFYFSPSGCPNGSNCTFSHQKYNSPCQFFELDPKSCRNGSNCPYLHHYQYREYGRIVSSPSRQLLEKENIDTSSSKGSPSLLLDEVDPNRKTLLELPADTVSHISNFLSRPRDALSMVQTCRMFHTIFSNPNFSVFQNVWFSPPESSLPKSPALHIRKFVIDLSFSSTTQTPNTPVGYPPQPCYYPYPQYGLDMSGSNIRRLQQQRQQQRFLVSDYIGFFPSIEGMRILYNPNSVYENMRKNQLSHSLKRLKRLNRISLCLTQIRVFDTTKPIHPAYPHHHIHPLIIHNNNNNNNNVTIEEEEEKEEEKESGRTKRVHGVINEMLTSRILSLIFRGSPKLRSLDFTFCVPKSVLSPYLNYKDNYLGGGRRPNLMYGPPPTFNLSRLTTFIPKDGEVVSSFVIDRNFIRCLHFHKSSNNIRELNFNHSSVEVSYDFGVRNIISYEKKLDRHQTHMPPPPLPPPISYSYILSPMNNINSFVEREGRFGNSSSNFEKKKFSDTCIVKKKLEEGKPTDEKVYSVKRIRLYDITSTSMTVEFLLSCFPSADEFQLCGCGRLYSREEVSSIFERRKCGSCTFQKTLMKLSVSGKRGDTKTSLVKEISNQLTRNDDDDDDGNSINNNSSVFHILPYNNKLKNILGLVCKCFQRCEECEDFFGECSKCVCGKSTKCRKCLSFREEEDEQEFEDEEEEENRRRSNNNNLISRRGRGRGRRGYNHPSYYTSNYHLERLVGTLRLCSGGCMKHFCGDCIGTSFQCKSTICISKLYCQKCRLGGYDEGSIQQQHHHGVIIRTEPAFRCSLCKKRKCMSSKIRCVSSAEDLILLLSSSTKLPPPYIMHHLPPPHINNDYYHSNFLTLFPTGGGKKGCSKMCMECEASGWCFECFFRLSSPHISIDTRISKWLKKGHDIGSFLGHELSFDSNNHHGHNSSSSSLLYVSEKKSKEEFEEDDQKVCVFQCSCGTAYKMIHRIIGRGGKKGSRHQPPSYYHPPSRSESAIPHTPFAPPTSTSCVRYAPPIIVKLSELGRKKYFKD